MTATPASTDGPRFYKIQQSENQCKYNSKWKLQAADERALADVAEKQPANVMQCTVLFTAIHA